MQVLLPQALITLTSTWIHSQFFLVRSGLLIFVTCVVVVGFFSFSFFFHFFSYVFVLCLVLPMLSMSLDCPFLICSSVFSRFIQPFFVILFKNISFLTTTDLGFIWLSNLRFIAPFTKPKRRDSNLKKTQLASIC